jgi:hypothetical protein
MGKVASKSIEESLNNFTTYNNIIHVHHLSYNELSRISNWYNNDLNVETPDYIKWSLRLRKSKNIRYWFIRERIYKYNKSL